MNITRCTPPNIMEWSTVMHMRKFATQWLHQISTIITRCAMLHVWATNLCVYQVRFHSLSKGGGVIELWPCAIRSCHNRDMPKISSEYAFVHLQWHNLKSVHPTIVKVYIFGKLFLQGIQKWLYFCGRDKSKNIMADQKLKFW